MIWHVFFRNGHHPDRVRHDMDSIRTSESLSDDRLSWWEKVSLLCLIVIILLTLFAFISQTLLPGNALQSILDTYFLDPIRAESSADGSYNQINTMAYNVTLILSVICIGAIMRWLRMPATECHNPCSYSLGILGSSWRGR